MTIIRPTLLAPSILTADFARLGEEVRAAERGGADALHLDVMDGVFVPNISFGPLVVRAIHQQTELPLDVHLMLQNPDPYLQAFADAGATTLTVHVEVCPHLHRTIQQIIDLGCKAGVALNPATSVETVREIVPFVDQVLIMGVNPGFGSQRFIRTTLSKLRRMRQVLEQLNPISDLEVDGGVSAGNIAEIRAAGANMMVVGSSIYNERGTVEENIQVLKEALQV